MSEKHRKPCKKMLEIQWGHLQGKKGQQIRFRRNLCSPLCGKQQVGILQNITAAFPPALAQPLLGCKYSGIKKTFKPCSVSFLLWHSLWSLYPKCHFCSLASRPTLEKMPCTFKVPTSVFPRILATTPLQLTPFYQKEIQGKSENI